MNNRGNCKERKRRNNFRQISLCFTSFIVGREFWLPLVTLIKSTLSIFTKAKWLYPPMTVKLTTRLRLHVGIATLALALGWISVPLSLATWEADVCEMECCIAEGYCCCEKRHAYVKGHEPKLGDVALKAETSLTAPCPAGCAASRASSQNNLPCATHAIAPVKSASISLPRFWDRFPLNRQFAAQPSSPRAPPLL